MWHYVQVLKYLQGDTTIKKKDIHHTLTPNLEILGDGYREKVWGNWELL